MVEWALGFPDLVDVDAVDHDGATALFWAARYGREASLVALLRASADPNKPHPEHGIPPVYIAARNNHLGALAALLADPRTRPDDATKADGHTAVWAATCEGHHRCLRVLLDRKARPDIPSKMGQYPVWIAACRGNTQCLRMLITAQAGVNAQATNVQGEKGLTPLYTTINNQTINFEVVQVLLDAHADSSIQTNAGNTPMSLAINKNATEIVELLKKHTVEELSIF